MAQSKHSVQKNKKQQSLFSRAVAFLEQPHNNRQFLVPTSKLTLQTQSKHYKKKVSFNANQLKEINLETKTFESNLVSENLLKNPSNAKLDHNTDAIIEERTQHQNSEILSSILKTSPSKRINQELPTKSKFILKAIKRNQNASETLKQLITDQEESASFINQLKDQNRKLHRHQSKSVVSFIKAATLDTIQQQTPKPQIFQVPLQQESQSRPQSYLRHPLNKFKKSNQQQIPQKVNPLSILDSEYSNQASSNFKRIIDNLIFTGNNDTTGIKVRPKTSINYYHERPQTQFIQSSKILKKVYNQERVLYWHPGHYPLQSALNLDMRLYSSRKISIRIPSSQSNKINQLKSQHRRTQTGQLPIKHNQRLEEAQSQFSKDFQIFSKVTNDL